MAHQVLLGEALVGFLLVIDITDWVGYDAPLKSLKWLETIPT